MTQVKKPRLAGEDVAVTAVEVRKVAEDATVPCRDLCQVRHHKLGPARTSKETFSPLALETRARMKICSALPWRRWRCTYVRSLVPKLPKNGPSASKLFSKSQSIRR